ncbi:UNVERIFIED_CONTAM: Zinc finger CCCH domain-containing protein 30 [Sesamum radiatum]|uniref:Zinc finger CCCH domain-containing protein 30 n=1 Tax=Sesamum radiatum TaxID=300843 RepID=A0AAW2LCG3_SESRA
MNVNLSNVENEDAFASLLELAANNDLEGFQKYVDREPLSVDVIGLWYGRQKGSNQMVLQHRTPLMVAATYGSIDVLKHIISLPEVDVNRSCGSDGSTALHCAASGGSLNAVDVVKLLLAAGADPNLADANGRRPVDVIIVSPKFQGMKYSLQIMLKMDASFQGERNSGVSIGTSNANSPPLSPSPESGSPGSPSESGPSPNLTKFSDVPVSPAPEKKEYPIDPSLPDIKNSIYSTDEFRMFSFKVRPCSRAYSHDWTECPFVHRVKMLEEGIRGSTITAVCHAQISAKELVEEGICVSMLMGFLSAGSTLLNIGLDCAKTVQVAIEEFVSLLTHKKNSDPSMSLLVPVFPHLARAPLLLMPWTLLQP